MRRLGVAGLVVGLLTGCAGAGEGPLYADNGQTICLPMGAKDQDVSLGAGFLRNRGKVEATITGVSAVEAEGLRLAESVLVPEGGSNVGILRGWQRAGSPTAVGHGVPADGSTLGLVVHLVRDGKPEEASLKGVRVEYVVGEQSYRTVLKSKLRLSSTTCS